MTDFDLQAKHPEAKTKLSLAIDDLETGDGMKTRLEFYDDDPDTIEKRVASTIHQMIQKMGYLDRLDKKGA